jgi:PAS domain S-box-containing protein
MALSDLSDDVRYRLLVEAVTDYAIYMLDPNGVVSSWNPGAQRFKGYEASEIIGQHFSRFYTDADQKIGLPQLALTTAAQAGKFESEGWRVRKDGTCFWAHVVIDPIRDRDGSIVGYSKITRDLTERKKAEDALQKSEQQFRLLVQGVTGYAIYMLDMKGRVTNWNLGAERIKGYLSHEIIGHHYSKFYTEEDRAKEEPQKALDTAIREGRFENEGWRVRKDGTRFWATVVIDPIRDEKGEIFGFAIITRDISEWRQMQEDLDKAREILLQSQKMDAIGQLTGGIAHDFNNLLMAILGSLELVRTRTSDDPKIIALLDNAIHGAERGITLTQRLLAFARRQDLKAETVDIAELVHGMTDLVRRSLGPSVAIESHFPLNLSSVKVDANQLEMALLNLMVNARDAMPEGGDIILSARERGIPTSSDGLKPGRYICLTVTDSGEGMDKVTLERATEPFFTTKGLGKGTGLGLSMVHGLAQQSGGQFFLKSQQGEGTTAETQKDADDSAASRDLQHTREAQKDMRSLVVLAVDDDGLVLLNTVMMLEELGHIALQANSGKEALDLLRGGNAVDLVITDQAMPKMTGVQLAEAIAHEWPNMPIILATGYAELPPGAGRNMPTLSKPFCLKRLAEALAEVDAKGQGVARMTARGHR